MNQLQESATTDNIVSPTPIRANSNTLNVTRVPLRQGNEQRDLTDELDDKKKQEIERHYAVPDFIIK